MRHPNQRQYHPALPAKCAVLKERSSRGHPINELRWATIALLLLATLLTGCADVMDLDDASNSDVGPAQLLPPERADPTADDSEPDGRSQAGATQVVRADTETSLRDDPAEVLSVGVTATPGLDPSLALTASAHWLTIQSTAVPPPPVTGGGPGEGYEGESWALAHQGPAGSGQAPDQAAPWLQQSAEYNRESYAAIEDNPFVAVVGQDALSTFAIDVDTASYANVRRFLDQGRMPPPDAVRIEELVNYFDYEYPPPDAQNPHPFSVMSDVVDAPWEPDHRLVHIALQGRQLDSDSRAPRNLVFLIDVSGSMADENKLPLVQDALQLLVEQMQADDSVAMVVYAGSSGLVLPATPGIEKDTIREAIERLQAGGSTNGGEGIRLAYDVAADAYIPGGVNRVILATDGDFNVGVTSHGDLLRMIEREARRDISLTVLGFGMGNLNDATLEQLADHGDGNYGYVDTLGEAEKMLVHQVDGTLVTIAKDVKVQVEFNPAAVAAYRLIGYENRALENRDFADDTKDAGEIGAGHAVTALYEVVPVASEPESEADALPVVPPLRYQVASDLSDLASSGELLTLSLRYKQPYATESDLLTYTVVDDGNTVDLAHGDAGFAAAVAAFGMLLRESPHSGEASWEMVLDLARDRVGADTFEYRAEFVRLVESARDLSARRAARGVTGRGS